MLVISYIHHAILSIKSLQSYHPYDYCVHSLSSVRRSYIYGLIIALIGNADSPIIIDSGLPYSVLHGY